MSRLLSSQNTWHNYKEMSKSATNPQNPDRLPTDDLRIEVFSSKRPVELAVVIPAYNERGNVAPMLAA